ncbi:ammonia permease [Brevibacterium ravenspurgense]|uniref:ammonia permease n=1 Tax=Brevibacterium ravenspurgense TaxID=479117 RepID=UPI002152E014|nr:ammonia permease [Brevibacterium ravenspurgense]
MYRWFRALVALVGALALGATSLLGSYPLAGEAVAVIPVALATAALVGVLAFGWPRLTDSPQRWLTSIMLFVFGLAGMGSTWMSIYPPHLEWLPLLTGLALLWAFVQNLARGIEASNAVANVSAQVAGVVVTLAACSWAASFRLPGDESAIIIGLSAIFLAQCASILPFPARYTSPLAIIAGLVGALIAYSAWWYPTQTLVSASIMGVLLGGLVAAVDRALAPIAVGRFHARSPRRSPNRSKVREVGVNLTLGATPIALGGVVVYIFDQLPLIFPMI